MLYGQFSLDFAIRLILLSIFFPIFHVYSAKLSADLGEPCENHSECRSGQGGDLSHCLEGSCICLVSAIKHPENGKCLKLAENVTEHCDVLEQCTQGSPGNHSECVRGECHCTKNAVPSEDQTRCLRKTGNIGATCEVSGQCTNPGAPRGQWKTCYEKTCQCTKNAVSKKQGHTCYPKVDLIDQPCLVHEQCRANLGIFSECKMDRCRCNSSAVTNIEGDNPNTQCLPAKVPIGYPCTDMAQCVGEPNVTSTCSKSGRCDCLGNYFSSVTLTKCLAAQNEIGGQCEETQQCQKGLPGKLSDCFEGVCNCTVDAVSQGDQHICYLKTDRIREPCQVDAQCFPTLIHSLCVDGVCQCVNDTVESTNNDKCFKKKYLGEGCSQQGECQHIPNTGCHSADVELGAICNCNDGYMEHPEVANMCIRKANVITDECPIHDSQCDGLEGARCQPDWTDNATRRCDCIDEDMVIGFNGKKCLEQVHTLMDSCQETVQCMVANSECRTEHCVCVENFEQGEDNKNACFPVRKNMGEPCQEHVQCGVLGVPCHDGICQCIPPRQYSQIEKLCLIPAAFGDLCGNDTQCRLGGNNFTVCKGEKEMKCGCMDNTEEKDDICWATKEIGDICENDKECEATIVGPVECGGGACNCKEGATPDSDKKGCSAGVLLSSQINLVVFVAVFLAKFT